MTERNSLHYCHDVSYQCWFTSEEANIYCNNFISSNAEVCSHLIFASSVRLALINAVELERNGWFSFLCCDWKEHRSIIKKLANRISYQTWYKGYLKGKFGRGVQICEGRVHIRRRIWTGGAKSAGVQIRCYTALDEGEREVRIILQSEGGDWVFLFLAVWASFSSLFGFCAKKTSVFQFCCSFRFADYTRFSFWFSVFVKNTNGFEP